VAIDIDGTLLDTRWQLPDRNRDAICDAVRTGVEVAIVTGRMSGFAQPVLDLLPCPVTAIVSNGAVVKTPDGATAVRHVVPRDVAASILAAAAEWPDRAALIFDRPGDGQMVIERIERSDPLRRAYAERNRAFVREVEPLASALTEDPVVVMFNGPISTMRALVDRLRALPGAGAFSVNLTEYESRDVLFVDVLAAGCTKGATLAEWARRRGYARDDVMALGDNLNDLEMLETAGVPVVMGNAVPALLERGWPITASNDKAGVAAAIHRYVLRG
jgi:Cof subfamily protein (haloacid dehalogenase superfamily)